MSIAGYPPLPPLDSWFPPLSSDPVGLVEAWWVRAKDPSVCRTRPRTRRDVIYQHSN